MKNARKKMKHCIEDLAENSLLNKHATLDADEKNVSNSFKVSDTMDLFFLDCSYF